MSKIDNPVRDAIEALKKDNETLTSAFSDIDQRFGKESVDYLSMTQRRYRSLLMVIKRRSMRETHL